MRDLFDVWGLLRQCLCDLQQTSQMPVCFALELKAFKKHFWYIFLVGFFHSGDAGKPRSIEAQ